MPRGLIPEIGNWYLASNRETFEVVACDLDEDSVSVQFFDGTVDEFDLESWREMVDKSASEPEDYSGSLDMDPEDFGRGVDLSDFSD